MLRLRNLIARYVLALLWIRRVDLGRHPKPKAFQELVSSLIGSAKVVYRMPHDLSGSGVVLYSRGWLGLLPTRRVIVVINDKGNISVSNRPTAMAEAFGVFFVIFLGLYELVALTQLLRCYPHGTCQSASVVALVLLAPLPIYFVALVVYGLQYLASASLYKFAIDVCTEQLANFKLNLEAQSELR